MTQITAQIPIRLSYGLYSDILTATSGKVIPQIKFGGWEVLLQDPFEEDIVDDETEEMHGKIPNFKNHARELM